MSNLHHHPPSDTNQLTDGLVSERKLSYACRNGFHDWCVGLPCECKCHLRERTIQAPGQAFQQINQDTAAVVKETKPAPATPSVTFESSSARSHVAPRFDLIPLVVLERLAARFEVGLKYGERNWQTGGPEFKRQCALHLVEHLWNWIEGRVDEDSGTTAAHLDAVLWNAAALVWYEASENREKSKGH